MKELTCLFLSVLRALFSEYQRIPVTNLTLIYTYMSYTYILILKLLLSPFYLLKQWVCACVCESELRVFVCI